MPRIKHKIIWNRNRNKDKNRKNHQNNKDHNNNKLELCLSVSINVSSYSSLYSDIILIWKRYLAYACNSSNNDKIRPSSSEKRDE